MEKTQLTEACLEKNTSLILFRSCLLRFFGDVTAWVVFRHVVSGFRRDVLINGPSRKTTGYLRSSTSEGSSVLSVVLCEDIWEARNERHGGAWSRRRARWLWRILFIYVTVKSFQPKWTPREPWATQTNRWNAPRWKNIFLILLKTWLMWHPVQFQLLLKENSVGSVSRNSQSHN